MKRFFITGTDTNVGKTYVTCQLLTSLLARTPYVKAIKPVVTGCWDEDGQLVNEDLLQIQHIQNSSINIAPWRFKPPISPHLAARADGEWISAQAIADFCYSTSPGELDYLLIEGAGGLMTPLNDHETWLDFILCSKIPVILVVGMRLGCLNHALLTASIFRQHQITCVGWIANCIDQRMLALSDNIQTLVKTIPWPLLGVYPFQG